MTSAYDIIDRLIGARTRVAQDALVSEVGQAATLIARADPSRVGIVVVNISDADLVVGLDEAVAAGRGLKLTPSGSFGFNIRDDFIMPSQAWWAKASEDASGIYTLEVLLSPDYETTGATDDGLL